MGSRRGSSRDTLYKGEPKVQTLHKKLTEYLEEDKPRELLLKTAIQTISNNDSALKAIVTSGLAAQTAYTEIEKLKSENKSVSLEEIEGTVKKNWNKVKSDTGFETENHSLSRFILDSIKEILETSRKKKGDSK